MLRRIIKIDRERCTGCGACAEACHEGAIEMRDGKACLTREDYCDGLGDCLPECPAGAIAFEMREAPAYDEAAVRAAKEKKGAPHAQHACPGAAARTLRHDEEIAPDQARGSAVSRLAQWPCQLKLVAPRAPYFSGAELLVAADCTAYAYAAFHEDFMRGRTTLIGCPKLDAVDYAEKLTAILQGNDVRSVTVARMEVPCCGGLEAGVRRALKAGGKEIPLRVVTIGIDGRVVAEA